MKRHTLLATTAFRGAFGLLLAIALCFCIASPALAINDTQTLTISSNPGADSYTTAETFTGRFNMSISGTWTGTVRLERSFDDGSTWVEVDSWTGNKQAVINEPQERGLPYRLGMANGDYSSGTVYLRLTKKSE